MDAAKFTVLVTGGGGRIGNFVISALLDRGHKVISFDRRKQRDDRARFVFGDVRNRTQVQAVMSECQVVCHLAEIASSKNNVALDEIFWSNAQAGSVVMQSAADLKLRRCIYTSTCQVYGCWDEPLVPPLFLPLDETHPVQPQNVYAQSKVANEGYAHLVNRNTGLPITILRFPWVVMQTDLTDGWFEWWNTESGTVSEFGSYVHALDTASAYVAAIEADRPGCEVYNIVAPRVMCKSPIRAQMLKQYPQLPPLPENWPEFKCPVLSDKAREQLGWTPRWDLREEVLKLKRLTPND